MLTDVNKYKALDAIGIKLWQPRKMAEISCEPLIVNARCAVVIFSPQSAAQKILDGMLSVLQLAAQDLMLVKVHAVTPDLELLANALDQWAPQTILQLSMDLPVITDTRPLVRTFSPEYLSANIQHKPQAYKDLLTLRKILDHGTSRRFA